MNKKKACPVFINWYFWIDDNNISFYNVINNQYRNEIPKIPDSTNLSKAVEAQISEAYKIARRKPSSENLGELGMVYHSSANYNQAAQCYQLAIKNGVHPVLHIFSVVLIKIRIIPDEHSYFLMKHINI